MDENRRRRRSSFFPKPVEGISYIELDSITII